MPQETTSVLLEIPSTLHDELLARFMEHYPNCSQNDAYTAGLALLLSCCPETAIAARRHLDQLVKEAIAS